MAEYRVDTETLAQMVEFNTRQADLFTRRANHSKRLLESNDEIYDHKLLSEHYTEELKRRAKELGLFDDIELRTISFTGRSKTSSEPSHYSLYINDNHVASFHANLQNIEKTLDSVLDKLEEVVKSAKITARRLEDDIHDIVGYENK